MRYERQFEEPSSNVTNSTPSCAKSKCASMIDHWCSWVMTSAVKQH
ncbi:hypothetical protein T06_13461, partial [Trichinella sp. T6]